MPTQSERISILSELEQIALYGLPDFDEQQRSEYFAFLKPEHQLIFSRYNLASQVHCALQIGYFKAKRAFFKFAWSSIPSEDLQFLLSRYFHGRKFKTDPISKHEHYTQRIAITMLSGYRPWTKRFLPQFKQQAATLAQRDVTPRFIVAELISLLHTQKIVRPGYTTLQTLVSEVLTGERQRLNKLLSAALNDDHKTALQKLLVRDNGLSELAALKQDAKHFGFRMGVVSPNPRNFQKSKNSIQVSLTTIVKISGVSPSENRCFPT